MPETIDAVQLRVILVGSEPAIWRRFTVPTDMTLPELHAVLQVVMGWCDDHLHSFYLRPARSRARTRQNWQEIFEDSGETLASILRGSEFELIYEYDFGDSWIHQIKIEKRLTEPGVGTIPRCIGGERACPPENCGGIGGYELLLEALGDESHPDYEEMVDWIGEDFDPEAFDPEKVNERLARRWSQDV